MSAIPRRQTALTLCPVCGKQAGLDAQTGRVMRHGLMLPEATSLCDGSNMVLSSWILDPEV
jgi:hypothetical protein